VLRGFKSQCSITKVPIREMIAARYPVMLLFKGALPRRRPKVTL
jgi:hypothetical protein